MLEAAQRATGLTPNKARALLGRFLFSGEEAEKPLAGLSGGERRRLTLAILVSSGANVLILDEPTNHLDLESREALEDALRSFEGSVLLVSHDRALLDAVGSRTVAVEDETLALVRGRVGGVRARNGRRGRREQERRARPRSRRDAPSRPAPGRRRTASAGSPRSSATSRRPRPRCRRSRTSWPTPRLVQPLRERAQRAPPRGGQGGRRAAVLAARDRRRLTPELRSACAGAAAPRAPGRAAPGGSRAAPAPRARRPRPTRRR